MIGYITYKAIFEAVRKANSADPEKIAAALPGLTIDTPVGEVQFRSADHQMTMPMYVVEIENRYGSGVMVNWKKLDGSKYLPG